MAVTAIVFPTLDEDNPEAEGMVNTWLAAEEAWVGAGTLLAEVHVGNGSGHLAAPTDGVLRRMTPEGQPVRQGDVIATLT